MIVFQVNRDEALTRLGRLVIGLVVWTCQTSPIAVCVYNQYDDPAHDQCVFCGHPEERK